MWSSQFGRDIYVHVYIYIYMKMLSPHALFQLARMQVEWTFGPHPW